jgi:hypothetical protein
MVKESEPLSITEMTGHFYERGLTEKVKKVDFGKVSGAMEHYERLGVNTKGNVVRFQHAK